MADLAREPSMEDILASIKRIIAEDGVPAAPAPRVRRGPPQPAANESDEVLELTRPVGIPEPAPAPAPTPPVGGADAPPPPAAAEPAAAAPRAGPELPAVPPSAAPPPAAPSFTAAPPPPRVAVEPAPGAPLVSEEAAGASRQALAALSAMVVAPASGNDNTLDGLVRELLRPMLKEWLDARLPELVETLVAKEIARIAGRGL